MPKRKFAKLILRVRAADDPTWTIDGRQDAADFDAGWTARQSPGEGVMLPQHSSRGFIAGWLAYELAWNARHQVTSGVYR